MNCVPPVPGFLETLREQCSSHGSILIFDEVMTGFRVALGGAQSVFGVMPDLTTLGKVIGGGLPIGAFGGRKEIMDNIAPIGPVYQAGTLSGSPLAVAAGLATLDIISEPGFYEALDKNASRLVTGFSEKAEAAGIPFSSNQVGGMFGCFFNSDQEISQFSQVMASNIAHFQQFFHAMLDNGVYLAPSAFETGFISGVHDDEIIQTTLDAAEHAFAVTGD